MTRILKILNDENSILRLGIILFIIAFIAALALSMVNMLTKDKIASQAKNDTINAVRGIFKDAQKITKIDLPASADKSVGELYKAQDKNDQVLGYGVRVSPTGYSGAVSMIVGVGTDKKVISVIILSDSETPGLGTKIEGADFRAQYVGKTAPFSVIRSGTPKGSEISAITGATISSKAVTTGVNSACDTVALTSKKG